MCLSYLLIYGKLITKTYKKYYCYIVLKTKLRGRLKISMTSLLYPAMQKFYSALSSLDRFCKEKNFFENISSLDTYIAFSPDLLNITSAERLACAESDVLVFMKVDSELNEEEYQFEGQHLGCMNYIVNNLKNDKKGKLDIGINNMLPIIDAFKKKREASNKFLT